MMMPLSYRPVVKRPLLFATLLAAASAFAAQETMAAPQSVAEIANYTGADRQDILEAGAKKEGKVTIYTSIGDNTIFEALGKKHPFIRVEVIRMDSPEMAQRVLQEYAVGRPIADTAGSATGALHPLLDAGILQPYKSPELASFRTEAVERNQHWAYDFESYVSLGFNTKLIAPGEAPQSLDDLLNPKWRDKMAAPGSSTLPNWIGAVLRDKGDRGEDFLRAVARQNIRIYGISGRAVANFIVSGEVAMSPAVFSSHLENATRKGASVAWRDLGGVYANVSGVSLLKNAPHPHAAMLYLDFAFSHAAQTIFLSQGYASGRRDIDNPNPPKKIYYLSEEPNYNQDYEKWSDLAIRIFGKGSQPPAK